MAEYVRDTFTRTVASGWGTGETGGAWTESLANSLSSVTGTQGRLQFQATTLASAAHQRLASASAQRDVASACRLRLDSSLFTSNPAAGVFWTSWLRTSGATATPVGVYARLNLKGDGSMVLSVGYSLTGPLVELRSRTFPAGTATSGSTWVLEHQANDSPTQLRARIWPTTTVPTGLDGWLATSDETGAQVAGVYAIAAERGTVSPAASHLVDLQEYFVTDPPAAQFTWAAGAGARQVQFTSTSTGDITAYSWAFGDGTTGTGSAPLHTYAAPGTYNATLTVTTRWGATYAVGQFVTASTATAAGAPILPIVQINGTDVCDELFSVDWSLGREHWVDPLSGLTCSIRLRGAPNVYTQGMTVAVSAPLAASTVPLWVGVIDEVSETRNPFDARDETLIIAMDTASRLARRHVMQESILPLETLPGRLDDLKVWDSLVYRYRYVGYPVEGGRWAALKKKTQKADKLNERTYLDLVSDAMAASLAFGYTARDGAISYAPWEAPPGLPSTPQLNFDTGLDCPSRVTIDRRTPDGMVNRWIIGGGNDYAEQEKRPSIETYGERAYSVADEVLDSDNLFFFQVTRWEDISGPGMATTMAQPARALTVEIPVTDWAQKVIIANPLDLAIWNGTLYSVMGVRHSVTVSDVWRVEISLDRNPWAIDGRTPP